MYRWSIQPNVVPAPAVARHRFGLGLGTVLAALLALAWPAFATPSSGTNLVLNDVHGAPVRPLTTNGQKATLFLFLMHDCPVANSYAPEINRLVAEYEKIRCFIVYVESDLTPKQAQEHVKDYGFKCSALLDPEHQLVAATGVTISPEAALLSPAGKLLYRGRIDDRVTDFGKRRVEPTRRDLRLALDAVLADKRIPDSRTKAIGCYIPDTAPAKPRKTTP